MLESDCELYAASTNEHEQKAFVTSTRILKVMYQDCLRDQAAEYVELY